MQTKKFLILINLFLLIIFPAHGEVFSPTLLELSAPEIIPYEFDGSEIEIPVTVSGTPASVVFLVFTQGKGSAINNVRNGYLGWHYVNKIDTCVYVSPDYQFLPGDHVITWEGRDADGNIVAPGAYTYYIWAYDNVSSKQLASPLKANWEDASTFKTHSADGMPLDNPVLFGGIWESYKDLTERSRQKWIIGTDPSDTGSIETCSYMGWYEHAPLVPDPYSDNMFFIVTVENNFTSHLMKYSWSPNGTGELQTGWGVDGEVTWNINTISGEWSNYMSLIYAGNDVLVGTNTDISGISTESELVLIDAVEGYETKRIDLSEWWIRVQDGEAGGQQSSGPSDFDVRHGLLFIGSHSSCLNQLIDPFDEDWNRWVNQNGDYLGDHNFEDTSNNPWICHDYNVAPYKYQFTADDNLFSIFPSYDMGSVSFGLYAPDGTGIGYYAYAGETRYGKWAVRFIDYGSAYDGIYSDNRSIGENVSWHFIGHDSIKGRIASSFLVCPNGGEIWETGTLHDIVWQSYVDVGQVSIQYSTDGGVNWDTIVESVDVSTERYTWTTPDTGSTNCLVRITDTSNPEATCTSSSVFTISPPFVCLTTPNGGEKWAWGKTYSINWTSVGIENVCIEFSVDNDENWEIITESIEVSSGSCQWEIPEIESSECLVKIRDLADTGLDDVSDNVFNLSEPYLTIISPNGMEHWYSGEKKIITWDSYGVENIKLEFSVDGGLTWNPIAESVDALEESYLWITPYLQSALCLVKISDTANHKPVDLSDVTFEISTPQSVEESVPKEFEVFQNTPNPFNPTTSITFSLPEPGNVIITIFNINGQKVDTLSNGYLEAGRHTVNWDGSGFSAGLYFYNVKYGGFSKTMKMLLMK